MIKSERRWQIRKLIVLVNLMLLGLAFYMDYNQIVAVVFINAMMGFQTASAIWFAADYATAPRDYND